MYVICIRYFFLTFPLRFFLCRPLPSLPPQSPISPSHPRSSSPPAASAPIVPAAASPHQIRRPPTSGRCRRPWSRCRSSLPPPRRCEEHEPTRGGGRLHLPWRRRATVAGAASLFRLASPTSRAGELRRAELELRSSRTRACLTGSSRLEGQARLGSRWRRARAALLSPLVLGSGPSTALASVSLL